MSRLCLGTVQFGMDYGLHGRTKTDLKEALEILDLASGDIEYLDTAFAYGSETVVGSRTENFKIISKAPPEKLNANPNLLEECLGSCERTKTLPLDGYLFHTPEHVYDDDLVRQLFTCKTAGYANNVGVSVYDLEEALRGVELGFDYVQFPYSVLDRRFEKQNFFERAKDKGVTLFARSPFIQGLLARREAPKRLSVAQPFLDMFSEISMKHGFSNVESALMFSITNPDVDFTVFGVHDTRQILENLHIVANENVSEFSACREELCDKLSYIPIAIVVASLWSK